jgi:hypothetical protein
MKLLRNLPRPDAHCLVIVAATLLLHGPTFVSATSPVQDPALPPLPSSCPTLLPAPDWVCVNGGWVPPDHPIAVGAQTTPPRSTLPPPSRQPRPSPPPYCAKQPPMPGWVCTNAGWIPPSVPYCPTVQPAASWHCVNGGWVPPDFSAGIDELLPVVSALSTYPRGFTSRGGYASDVPLRLVVRDGPSGRRCGARAGE